MNVSRRQFFGFLGAGAASAALPGCFCGNTFNLGFKQSQIALQLYSIRTYIRGKKDKNGKVIIPGVGLAKALDHVASIGYKGVEFAGYADADGKELSAKEIRKMLADSGLKACGTHVSNSTYGFDTKNWKYDPEILKKTCEFNLEYGNNYICCPGGGNMPEGIKNAWTLKRGNDNTITLDESQAEWLKRLVDFYNFAAADAAKMGCRIGLHNHTWEFGLLTPDGDTYWDYFFSNTDPSVCMEQDVGWTVCAGYDPADMYRKYPHRSPTLHAKENGYGAAKFDAILGKPGIQEDGEMVEGVDWNSLIPMTNFDNVEWYVVECEAHEDNLSAVLPSYNFLQSKGLS